MRTRDRPQARPRAIRANYLRLSGALSQDTNSFWFDAAALLPLHLTTALGLKNWVVLLSTVPRLNRIVLLRRFFRRVEMDITILNVQQIALFKCVGRAVRARAHWHAEWVDTRADEGGRVR